MTPTQSNPRRRYEAIYGPRGGRYSHHVTCKPGESVWSAGIGAWAGDVVEAAMARPRLSQRERRRALSISRDLRKERDPGRRDQFRRELLNDTIGSGGIYTLPSGAGTTDGDKAIDAWRAVAAAQGDE